MDPPIHALKFAEDLIRQVLISHDIVKDSNHWGFMHNLDMFQKQRCPIPVSEAVLGLMEHRKERIQTSFDNLRDVKVFNISDFRFELSLTAIMYFKEGYDHFKFLNYCALLGGLAVRYAKSGHHDIPTGCSQLLAYFLNFWMYSMVFNPNSDYFELACVAQRVRRNLMILERKKQMKAADEEEVEDTQKVPEKDEKSQKMTKVDEVSEAMKDTQKVPDECEESRKMTKKGDEVSEVVKDTQKVPDKGEESRKMTKKADEVSGKHGKEAQKKTEKQKESAKAVHKELDKGKGDKNTPKKKRK